MGFKTVDQYNEEKYGNFFVLRNNRDAANVVFMYRSKDDVLIGDVHYIKSADYSGYVHCLGKGCPACAKGIRVQYKLFIPLYNVDSKEIQFFDRNARFEPELHDQVFKNYPDPSQFIFQIVRDGAAGDVNTKYLIQAKYKNSVASYDDICQKFDIKMPDYYENVCRSYDAATLDRMLNTSSSSAAPSDLGDMPSYTISPRASALPAAEQPTVDTSVSSIPEDIAEALDDLDMPDFE